MEQEELEGILKKIARTREEGDYVTARSLLDDAIARHPEEKSLLVTSGDLYSQEKRWPEAVKAYKSARAVDREDREIQTKLRVAALRNRAYITAGLLLFLGLPFAAALLGFLNQPAAVWVFVVWASVMLLVGLAYLGTGHIRLGGAMTAGLGVAIGVSLFFGALWGLLTVIISLPFILAGNQLEIRAKKEVRGPARLLEGGPGKVALVTVVAIAYAVGYWSLVPLLPLDLDDNTKFASFFVLLASIIFLVFQRKSGD